MGCKNQNFRGGDCKIIEPNSSIKGLFDEKMDIVFANQSLYYIPKTELKQNILEFYECLNQGGILFATMMSEKNYLSLLKNIKNLNCLMSSVELYIFTMNVKL